MPWTPGSWSRCAPDRGAPPNKTPAARMRTEEHFMKKVLLSLIVGVVFSLSSAAAQPRFRGQVSLPQMVPRGAPATEQTRGIGTAAYHGLLVAASQLGDLDGDGDIDNDDLNLLLAELNTPVSGSTCGVRCDLNEDGAINALDARQLVARCTRPRCATE